MKIVASKESYAITKLDKEAIKAIRFCCGYTPDLRKPLSVCGAKYDFIYDFIWENRAYIIGVDFAVLPDCRTNDFRHFENLVSTITHCVCRGITI